MIKSIGYLFSNVKNEHSSVKTGLKFGKIYNVLYLTLISSVSSIHGPVIAYFYHESIQ